MERKKQYARGVPLSFNRDPIKHFTSEAQTPLNFTVPRVNAYNVV